jgi:hypothetical protein
MADRTIRRTYTGTIPNPVIDPDANGSIADGIKDSAGTSGRDDTPTVSDGTEPIGDTELTGGGIGIVEIDPEQLSDYIAGADSGSGDTTGKRERKKRGPNKRTTGAKKAQDSIAPFVQMIHALMAAKIPEMELEPEEAERVSSAYIGFCQHHDIPILSAKRMSEIELISMIWMVYGTRVIAIRNRIKEETKVNAAKRVTPITQHG